MNAHPGTGSPRAAIAVTLLGLVLAGCAAPLPAPVEDRARAPGGQVPAPTPGGSTRPAPAVESLPGGAPAETIGLGSTRGPAPTSSGVPAGAVQEPPSADSPVPARPPADLAADPAANPAVIALVNRANRQSNAGDRAGASASLERALKIEPGNAWLWHRLAVLRLEQGRHGDAAALAAKSNSLAAGDARLQADNWRLIARVHRQRGEDVAARAAEERAQRLDPTQG